MSEPRIAVVAEGQTDFVLIEAALSAILPGPFVLVRQQPESTQPRLGNGWGGVLRWCEELRLQGVASIDQDPTLAAFDLVIVHLDADVAHKAYSDLGVRMAERTKSLPPLPCVQPCPPPDDTVAALEQVLLGWLGMAHPGTRTVLCLPSKAIESWLAAAVFPDDAKLLEGLECALNLEGRLASLPKGLRIRKSVLEYHAHAIAVRQHWDDIQARCARAKAFDTDVRAVLALAS